MPLPTQAMHWQENEYRYFTVICEDEKKEFAKNSRYKYENGKFLDAAGEEVEDVTDEMIAIGLATTNSMENLTGKMNAFAKAIDKTNLKNLYKKEDG